MRYDNGIRYRQNSQVIEQHKTLIRESEAASKFQKANEEAIAKGEQPKPIPENLVDKVMSGAQIAKHENPNVQIGFR